MNNFLGVRSAKSWAEAPTAREHRCWSFHRLRARLNRRGQASYTKAISYFGADSLRFLKTLIESSCPSSPLLRDKVRKLDSFSQQGWVSWKGSRCKLEVHRQTTQTWRNCEESSDERRTKWAFQRLTHFAMVGAWQSIEVRVYLSLPSPLYYLYFMMVFCHVGGLCKASLLLRTEIQVA